MRGDTRIRGDILFAKCKLAIGNNYTQLFTDSKMVYTYLITTKKYVGKALRKLARDSGISNILVIDRADEKDRDNTEFQIAVKDLCIHYRRTKLYSPLQNRAEDLIKIMKS